MVIVGSITGNTNTLAGNVPPKVHLPQPLPAPACAIKASAHPEVYLPYAQQMSCWLHRRSNDPLLQR